MIYSYRGTILKRPFAGRLRHRGDIERRVEDQDPITGEVVLMWKVLYDDVPMAIEPFSVRSFIESHQGQIAVDVVIVIRYIPDLVGTMRIRSDGVFYNPVGFLPDKVYGNEYLTVPCRYGVNDGE